MQYSFTTETEDIHLIPYKRSFLQSNPRSQVSYQVIILYDLNIPFHNNEKVSGRIHLKQPLISA